MLETLIWVLVVLTISGVIVWRGEIILRDHISLTRQDQQARRELEAQKSLMQAEMDSLTLDERVALQKAELVKRTAEMEADTKTLSATQADRIKAQQAELHGTAQARIEYAQLHGGGGLNTEALKLLTKAYQSYNDSVLTKLTFESWIGNIDLKKLLG